MLDPTTKLVLATLDDCIRVSPSRRKLVIDELRADAAQRGGVASYRYWLSRYDDYFSEARRHNAPPRLFTIALHVCGEAPWLDPWLAEEQRLRRGRAADERRVTAPTRTGQAGERWRAQG